MLAGDSWRLDERFIEALRRRTGNDLQPRTKKINHKIGSQLRQIEEEFLQMTQKQNLMLTSAGAHVIFQSLHSQ